jgi:predicted nicotinamide N-methyase
MDLFVIRFLALDRIPKILPQELVLDLAIQDVLLEKTLRSIKPDFPLPVHHVRNFLESIIRTCEALRIEVIEEVYERITALERSALQESSFGCFRIGEKDIFFKVHGDQFALVQDGSTGFMTWEAGRCLSWFLSCMHDVRGKRILEIGCGTGVAGIVTSSMSEPSEYIFTDYHESTLRNAQENWKVNHWVIGDSCSAKFENLDMYKPETQRVRTDIITGADILYDEDLALALVRTLENPNLEYKEALIASTVRTQATYDLFIKTLRSSNTLRFEIIFSEPFSKWVELPDSSEWRSFIASTQLRFDPIVELIKIVRVCIRLR